MLTHNVLPVTGSTTMNQWSPRTANICKNALTSATDKTDERYFKLSAKWSPIPFLWSRPACHPHLVPYELRAG